ncbi:MAG: ATP-binding protein, partial [Candidatus Competibacterales bacterium]
MSFRLKTILGIALIEVVLLAILLVSGHRYLQLSNEAQLQQRATTVAALFAAAAKDAVLSTDLAALESLVAEMLGNPDVVYARIKGDGIVLAQGGDGAALGRPYRADGDLAAVDDGVFDVHGDIEEAGFGFGRVELGLTVLPIRQVLAQARWATTAIAVLEVLLVALFSWLLGLYLTRQLQRLKAASNAVAEHGPGYQIPVVGKDEVAAAVGAFNHMSSRLADAQREQQQALISQRQLALQLMANEARFYQLFQASHDAIVLHDLKGHIVDANPQALALFDYPKDAFHRLIVPELHPPEALASARGALEAVASGGAVRFETQFRRRDGSTFPAEVSARRFEAGDDVLVQGIIRDITERREAEEALRRARHQAEEANRAKSRFLAAMSHDIRTPLNVILNANELLLETALDEEQRAFGRAVGEAGTTLMALVNDVLEFSKIEAGQLSLNLSTFEPRALAGGVMGLFTGAAEAKGLQFVCRCGPALPAVRSDPDRLRQVLVNLVGNAVKFTEAGHIELQVTLAPGAGGTQLGFAVADTGIGIPAERCAKVFGEFTQHHDGPHRRGGTGLGLAICQRVVKGLGGEIGVESREGEGSRFWFRVPVEVVGGTTAGDAAPNP